MSKPPKLENFFAKASEALSDLLPDGAKSLSDDLKLNWQESMQQVIASMDLIPRKEFDIQTKVLARTREKVTALEEQLKQLEERLKKGS
jgi:BMFP domain-containing protein YqiC